MHRSQMELVALDQQNAGLVAAKLHRNAVDNGIKQLVQLKDRADFLCCLLHRNQNVYPALLENCRTRSQGKMTGSAWHGRASIAPSIRLQSRLLDSQN